MNLRGKSQSHHREDFAAGHNRFALRAYSTTDANAKDKLSVAGFNKMAIYANLPNATTQFFLTKVPAGAHGQTSTSGSSTSATRPATETCASYLLPTPA